MPPRWLIGIILVGWAVTTSQLLIREFLPTFSSNVPAPILIALADETVGSRTTTRWTIKRDGQEVMRATSGLDYTELPTEKFLFWMEYNPLPASAGLLNFRILRTEYTTGRNGFLQGIQAKMELEGPPGLPLSSENFLEGTFEEGKLIRKVTQKLAGSRRQETLSPVPTGNPPMVWFPFMPVWRVARINPGDKWQVYCVDPLGDMVTAGQGRISGKILNVEVLKGDAPWKDSPKATVCRRLRVTGDECQMEIWIDPDSGRVMKQEVVLEFRHRWSIEREE